MRTRRVPIADVDVADLLPAPRVSQPKESTPGVDSEDDDKRPPTWPALRLAERIASLGALPERPTTAEVLAALGEDVYIHANTPRGRESLVGDAMRSLGYARVRVREGGRQVRRYVRPAPAGTQPSGLRGITQESPELRKTNSRNAPKGA